MANNLHWKERLQNPDYLGVYSLYEGGVKEPQKLLLTIKDFKKADVAGTGGKISKDLGIILFHETPKGLIVKATNGKRIETLLKTPFTDEWIGKQIVLHQEMEKMPATKTVEAVLRVSLDPADYPGRREPMTREHEKFAGMMAALKSGTTTLDKVQVRYSFTAELLADISRELQAGKEVQGEGI